ncbi:MAG: thiamine ABC transporter substrate-binding protein [Bacillota bacterium]|nr:MAG: thiamine ABC transporter substrate-binding protein [Bacillota bacterium]
MLHAVLRSRRLLVLAAVLLSLAGAALAGGQAAQAAEQRLVVYTYDSFAAGPAQAIKEGFEALHPDVEVVFLAPGDAGETLARVIAELHAGGSDADVLMGLGDTQLPRALDHGVFMPLDRSLLPNLAKVPAHLDFDETGHVVPFDHGYVTIIYDSRVLSEDELPRTLEDLTDPRFRGRLIAIDPRTGSTGHAFLMWTIAEYGDPGYLEFWERLAPSLLTVTASWDAAYSLYQAGEAPMMVSYSTDTAAGVYFAGSDHSRVLTPQGQAYRQIEAVGIVSGTDVPELAHRFVDYVLSEEVQSLIPTTNWMFPVNAEAPLPDFFEEYAVIPENPVQLDLRLIEENEQRWLREWARLMTGLR